MAFVPCLAANIFIFYQIACHSLQLCRKTKKKKYIYIFARSLHFFQKKSDDLEINLVWPDNFFTKLNDAVVWPVVSYGAAVWGFKSFSCMNAVHNRAMRYFLGVGKYTPNTALAGEMSWIPPIVRQWKTIALSWSSLSCSFQSRVNKRIALWANHKSGITCKKCFFYVNKQFSDCNLAHYCCLDNQLPKRTIVDDIIKKLTSNYVSE